MHLEQSSTVVGRSVSITRQVGGGREEPSSDVDRPGSKLVAEQAAHALLGNVFRYIVLSRKAPAVADQVRVVLVEDDLEVDVVGSDCDASVHVAVEADWTQRPLVVRYSNRRTSGHICDNALHRSFRTLHEALQWQEDSGLQANQVGETD